MRTTGGRSPGRNTGSFEANQGELDRLAADVRRARDGVRYMNAGWTKVYALMLDGFPIYDGRVGAAMGYLVQRYCVSARLCQVPTRLRFRWGAARGRHNRNPSTRSLWFPGLTATNPRTWAECNLWAAWILGCFRHQLLLRRPEALSGQGRLAPGSAPPTRSRRCVLIKIAADTRRPLGT